LGYTHPKEAGFHHFPVIIPQAPGLRAPGSGAVADKGECHETISEDANHMAVARGRRARRVFRNSAERSADGAS